METGARGWGWIGRLQRRTFDRLLVGGLLLFGLINALLDLRLAEREPGYPFRAQSGLAISVVVGLALLLVQVLPLLWRRSHPSLVLLLVGGAFGARVLLGFSPGIEGILFRLLGGFDAGWVTTVEKFFLGQNASALIKSFGQPFPSPGAAAPLVTAGVAVLVLAFYGLVFAGVSSLIVRTRDVT